MNFSRTLLTKLEHAGSVCALTGAGISAESGVPTFRGDNGLWSKFKPEELANFDAFIRNPALVWEWYSYRKKVMRDVRPNPGHEALVSLERMVADFTLITQNVDNLHRRAGNKNVLELHGNIERSYCIDCGRFVHDVVIAEKGRVPACEHCGGLVRPDVVWFGEFLPQEIFADAEQAARRADVFLCIGTSAVVYPAASLSLIAKEAGSYVVEINVERTDLSSRFDETVLGKAGDILPSLIREFRSLKEPHP
ncbi:MAG: NAD-dependent deacylase [Ignavibacteriales bacterium]|nr:NAD-dependent deacylase [Ignavibacteriales bacterium]